MSTLIAFSEKERAYHADQARQNSLREQRTILLNLEQEHAAKSGAWKRARTSGVAT